MLLLASGKADNHGQDLKVHLCPIMKVYTCLDMEVHLCPIMKVHICLDMEVHIYPDMKVHICPVYICPDVDVHICQDVEVYIWPRCGSIHVDQMWKNTYAQMWKIKVLKSHCPI